MRPEHTRNPRMRQHVSVHCQQLGDAVREGVVRLWRGSVMVVNVGEGKVGAHAHQPRQAILCAKKGVIVLEGSLVHGCLQPKVPGPDMTFSGVHKLYEHVCCGVGWVFPVIVVPELSNRQLSTRPCRGIHVLLYILGVVAPHKVKAQRGETQVPGPGHVVQPRHQRLAHLWVGVVHVRSSVVAGLRLGLASAGKVWVGVVAHQSPWAPVQAFVVVGQLITEEDPLAVLVLPVTTAVIDDDVQDGTHALSLERTKQSPQLLVGAVGRVQVVQLGREVALLCNTLRRGRQPDVRDACLAHVLHTLLDSIVPACSHLSIRPLAWVTAVWSGGFPVKALDDDSVGQNHDRLGCRMPRDTMGYQAPRCRAAG
mmetsp:Transcript_23971/g.66587  ORF Transcript_23971/g.66587 Transcript_23971/m.66587 type:complete len:367 (+) Transcript_23971:727-1827(+)